ncbi:MAG: DUF456 domain-containing protein [Opitutus sp.]
MIEFATWALTLSLMLVGFVGVIVPVLPGTTLILAAALLHKWIQPNDVTWLAIGFIALFWLLSVIADVAGVILGTRWFGGGKWGMAGATGGAFVGLFFSIPILILGTILGAVAAEKLLGRKTNQEAIKAGVGAAVGFVVSTVARFGCAAVMIGLFLVAALTSDVPA